MQYSDAVVEKGLARMEEIGLTDLHRLLLSLVPAESRVLEVGCASGYLSGALRERGCTVTGVEVVPRLADLAADKVDTLVRGSITKPSVLEQVPGDHDVLIMADVIEHLEDPWQAVADLATKLKPEARWLVTFPNIAHVRMRLQLLAGHWEYTDFGLLDRTHLRFFSRPSIERFVEEVGWVPSQVVTTHIDYPGRGKLLRIPGWSEVDAWLDRNYPNLVGAHFLVDAASRHGS